MSDHTADLEALDSSVYDTEAIEIDARNGNYDGDPEDYRHEVIVRNSLINGQFTQARQQCASYGLVYEEERFKFDHSFPAVDGY